MGRFDQWLCFFYFLNSKDQKGCFVTHFTQRLIRATTDLSWANQLFDIDSFAIHKPVLKEIQLEYYPFCAHDLLSVCYVPTLKQLHLETVSEKQTDCLRMTRNCWDHFYSPTTYFVLADLDPYYWDFRWGYFLGGPFSLFQSVCYP